jgi:hypothetical protein
MKFSQSGIPQGNWICPQVESTGCFLQGANRVPLRFAKVAKMLRADGLRKVGTTLAGLWGLEKGTAGT